MRRNISSLVVLAATGIVAQQAAAVVTFSFADNPDPNGQFIYTAPDFLGQDGFLTYNSQVPIDLGVDATGEGGSAFEYTDAIFSFSAGVGAIFDGPFPNTYFAPLFGGSMEFRTSGGDLLFSGTFGDPPAFLNIIVNTGSITVSVEVGGLNYVPGALLLADLSADIGADVQGFLPPFDAVWTLSNMPTLKTIIPPAPPGGGRAIDNVYLDDFQANSSFSGTTGLRMIPAPGAAALASLGLVMVSARRRR